MKVEQALIMAGGRGTRLGMGTKSHILYKGKILLEYMIECCVAAEIKKIVVFLPNKDIENEINKASLDRVKIVKNKYPQITWIQYPKDLGLGFRGAVKLVKKYFSNKPFFLMCGQSPQSALFLKNLGSLYMPGAIVVSGYKDRHDLMVSTGETKANEIVRFANTEGENQNKYQAKNGEIIAHSPYVLDFQFYDKYLKTDNYRNRLEYYPELLLRDGGKVYFIKNPIEVSEIDYKEELPELYKSIDMLVDAGYVV
jgi:NDP-sugar pyrophosphorylase family protein